jgi:ABC-type multidrug transport system ATPase subunit
MYKKMDRDSRVVLQVKNIKKNFQDITAVDNLSFDLISGEIFGLLGPNGAGKSTTLAILTGLVKADEGEVKIFSYDLKKSFIKAVKNMGVLVEVPSFYGYLSGFENLKLLSRIKMVKKGEIYATLEKLGMANWAKTKVKNYSSGMKKRLGIACALLGNPKILILDEPTSGLDPKGRQITLDLIKSLSKNESKSVIISSNLLHDIEAICDRALLIDKGKAIFCEQVDKLLKPIENSYTFQIEPFNKAYSTLKSFKGIKKLVKLSSNTVKVVLSNSSSGELNQYLVEKGYKVYEIKMSKRTLQELFLELKD